MGQEREKFIVLKHEMQGNGYGGNGFTGNGYGGNGFSGNGFGGNGANCQNVFDLSSINIEEIISIG